MCRQISRDAARALYEGRTRTFKNTWITTGHTDTLYLFGNTIAWTNDEGLWITMASWPTVTTRDRLNVVLAQFDIARSISIRPSVGGAYYGNCEISPSEVIHVMGPLTLAAVRATRQNLAA